MYQVPCFRDRSETLAISKFIRFLIVSSQLVYWLASRVHDQIDRDTQIWYGVLCYLCLLNLSTIFRKRARLVLSDL